MMHTGWILPAMVLAPVLLALISLLLHSPRAILRLSAFGTLSTAALSGFAVWRVFRQGPMFAAGHWFMLDALSAYHVAVMMTVFSVASLFGISYFREETADGRFGRRQSRRYGSLWFGSLAAMMLVLVSNNLGIMWIGIEATTLLTAFLICVHVAPAALEAMWKYLLMCSVGVALAFTGTLLTAASAEHASLHGTDVLLWTNLRDAAQFLNPALLKAGFIFLVVGYGTKAGLAPMHNWLPDAHSQAPAPVSAIFSGFLLNAALYCILRFLPLVEAATGHTGWGRSILVVFGLLSVLMASAFIVTQCDVKRLLAYSSVEHIGVMTLGFGIGGLGTLAALFHMLSHSLCKTLAFCCAGRLGQVFGTHDMRRITRVLSIAPMWGAGLLGGLLVLIGSAPLALFTSEFLILKAAMDRGSYVVGGLFLVGLAVVFVAVLRRMIAMACSPAADRTSPLQTHRAESLLILTSLIAMLVLGLFWPPPLMRALAAAANILGGAL
ncbi:MAG: hydrogenase 4 subunit F [Verrucomicrobia bacterium]|nr:hydrogenase 4 subunit F [Verrucomicrobiota bacterium]